jgi:hypothetical protein
LLGFKPEFNLLEIESTNGIAQHTWDHTEHPTPDWPSIVRDLGHGPIYGLVAESVQLSRSACMFQSAAQRSAMA